LLLEVEGMKCLLSVDFDSDDEQECLASD